GPCRPRCSAIAGRPPPVRSVCRRRPRGALLRAKRARPAAPHNRDELYIVAAGGGEFRRGEPVGPGAPGALLYVAAHEVYRFEDFSDDFAVWVVFYGPVK